MKLHAISDVHLRHRENRELLADLADHGDDWLILGGDIGETVGHLEWALATLAPKFARLVWVPGNHDLWTHPRDPEQARGVARYELLVETCRRFGALTPEDPFVRWDGDGGPATVAPLFLLYDYSFRPADVAREHALAWALKDGVMCNDEVFLHPDPHPSREAWCEARLTYTERRLLEETGDLPLVLVNHFPLRRDLVRIPRIPRFELWCGTRRTEEWHLRFGAAVVISGHLHVPATDIVDGVRFEEVSLGYPRQWTRRGSPPSLRQILPAPVDPVAWAIG